MCPPTKPVEPVRKNLTAGPKSEVRGPGRGVAVMRLDVERPGLRTSDLGPLQACTGRSYIRYVLYTRNPIFSRPSFIAGLSSRIQPPSPQPIPWVAALAHTSW